MTRICKVLIVENDAFVRNLLADVFEHAGYSFSTVESGAEMRRALDGDDHDIVVIDVTQPGGENGFDLAQLARERGCGTVLVTGDHRHLERLAESGHRYLLKPFRIQELLDVADKILTETAAQCMRRTRSDGSGFPAPTG
jgi:two-component system, OmpR family, response regulator